MTFTASLWPAGSELYIGGSFDEIAGGARLNVAGFAVTPAGSPVIATATVPVNELTAVAVTLTEEPAAPATTVSEVGNTAKVKSGEGGGGGGGGTEMVAVTVDE